MKRLVLVTMVAIVIGMLASVSAMPASQDPAKDLSKVSIAGKWTMSLESPQGPMSIAVVLKVDGTKVTGTLTSQMGETPLEGTYAEGVLNFGITFEGGGNSMQIAFAGKLTDENTLAGSLSGPMGDIPWSAVRIKE
jgi:hypothetical protein